MKRSLAESDNSCVQIVSCVIITHQDRVFIFERPDKDKKSSLYGKRTLWHGSHVSEKTGQPFQRIVSTGMDRVNESLFLGRSLTLVPVGYCWRDDENHLGIMLRLRIENDLTAKDLEKKEFRRSRGLGLSGKLIEWMKLQINEASYDLEPWSVDVVRNRQAFLGR
jgi:predicted NUDIX family phosphoesterase